VESKGFNGWILKIIMAELAGFAEATPQARA
jgi:hypothetical protein